MAKKRQARDKFPKRLFVNVVDPGEEGQFYNADVDHDGKDDGADVAIYELVEVKRQKVTTELV